jgi:hypothetical protein
VPSHFVHLSTRRIDPNRPKTAGRASATIAAVTDTTDIRDTSHTDRVDRFAQLWWGGDPVAAEVVAGPAPWPVAQTAALVIRAERV